MLTAKTNLQVSSVRTIHAIWQLHLTRQTGKTLLEQAATRWSAALAYQNLQCAPMVVTLVSCLLWV